MRNEELFKERPVWNAILTLAIPSVLSILVMLLYNMADMFFVGLLHDHVQVAAVSVVGPIFSLVTAAANSSALNRYSPACLLISYVTANAIARAAIKITSAIINRKFFIFFIFLSIFTPYIASRYSTGL